MSREFESLRGHHNQRTDFFGTGVLLSLKGSPSSGFSRAVRLLPSPTIFQKNAESCESHNTVRSLPLSRRLEYRRWVSVVDPFRNLLIDPRFRVSRPDFGGRAFR